MLKFSEFKKVFTDPSENSRITLQESNEDNRVIKIKMRDYQPSGEFGGMMFNSPDEEDDDEDIR